MAFEVIGGLGIFLIGMRYMSDGMQAVAGDRLRSLVNAVTNNRLLACTVGLLVTCLIQSSSITTVMAVGMVNAGIMNLVQSIGVILGANIGTTITGWILCLSVGKYGLPIIGISALFYLFAKKNKWKYTGMLCLGLGFVFFGLMLMKSGFHPLRELDSFQEWFKKFSPDTYIGVLKCCVAGALLTAIVQSSSATIGITISLATIGMIDFPTAAALVLGENIGTTITAFLASIGTTVNAKRASYAHIFVNLFGVLWITPIFFLYIKFVLFVVGKDPSASVVGADGLATFPYVAACIAATHSCFNIINVVVLLPFVGVIAKFLEKFVPDTGDLTVAKHLVKLDERLVQTPSIGIELSQKETSRMLKVDLQMMSTLREMIAEQKFPSEGKEFLFDSEDNLDIIQKEVAEFLTDLMGVSSLSEVRVGSAKQLRIADEAESVSDYIVKILKLNLKIKESCESISGDGLTGLIELHDKVFEFLKYVASELDDTDDNVKDQSVAMANGITTHMKVLKRQHLERVGNGGVSPLKSLSYTDMLSSYRKIKDHGVNISEILAGEK